MKPPYDISPKIINLVASISEKIGEVNATYLNKQSPTLRKQNKIKTIHSSLQIEGNTLTQDQITALVENKRIIGPQKDILEVLNAIKVYEDLDRFNWVAEKSFLEAHRFMMQGLIPEAGKYRTRGVGIVQGSEVAHVAPPATNVPYLMKDLFAYLKKSEEILLIKSCVFHYEMEFIHPFLDGNGRMGRLWQTIILLQKYPVFEFLPFETLIGKTQAEYYKVLSLCDRVGNSTFFIEYMLDVIDQSLAELLRFNNRTITAHDRIDYFVKSGKKQFNRKDYMNVFKDISSATATRDLKKAVELHLIEKHGNDNKTYYLIKNS
ncbi:Fic family protein [Flavobacterium arsenatis]|uniref:Fic family protein n=1 Tax=Flavobacterium arsenatis TaxID=1484332 RepID=A0ABU1TP65_9FLAO|nr:Fic family protein [Flavobacterium arsenatis]MDR6967653.1 Fic family protein [Flavobacterium arsenatis]